VGWETTLVDVDVNVDEYRLVVERCLVAAHQ
jgi:hypothetical protein